MARKNNLAFRRFTIIILIFTGGLLVYLYGSRIRNYYRGDKETIFTMYPGFGTYIPDGYEIHGIDVSRYQGSINWPMVKSMREKDIRLGFAFMKATEGVSLVDPQFKRNWRKSRESRLVRGAYHFFIPYRSGQKQAEFFISKVQLMPGDLPPVLDIETLKGSNADEMRLHIGQWLQLVESHYGVKPIIYTNANFYTSHLKGRFDDYPLWVAHYFERRQPRVDRNWHFWQHSEMGRVNGIRGAVDFNVFSGDSTDFKDLLLQ